MSVNQGAGSVTGSGSGMLVDSSISSSTKKENISTANTATNMTMSTSSYSGSSKVNQPGSPQDLTVFVQDLLDQMETKFTDMGDSILGRMDEMGKRMDELERSIEELMDQAGLEPPGKTPIHTTTAGTRLRANTSSSDAASIRSSASMTGTGTDSATTSPVKVTRGIEV